MAAGPLAEAGSTIQDSGLRLQVRAFRGRARFVLSPVNLATVLSREHGWGGPAMSLHAGIEVRRKHPQVAVADRGGEVLVNRNCPTSSSRSCR